MFRVHERTPAQPQGTHTSTQPQAPSTHLTSAPVAVPLAAPSIRDPQTRLWARHVRDRSTDRNRAHPSLWLHHSPYRDYIEDPHRHTALLSPVGQRLSERDRDCVRVTGGAADGIRRTLSTTHDLLRWGQLPFSPRAKGGASSGIIAAAS